VRERELAEELIEFVRLYPPNSGAAAAKADSIFHLASPGTAAPIQMIDLNTAPGGDIYLSE
jgi:hypothetical protein